MTLIKHLEKGDTFYEHGYGEEDEYVAITNPVRRDEGWNIYGRHTTTGQRVLFFVRDGYDHYGPELSR